MDSYLANEAKICNKIEFDYSTLVKLKGKLSVDDQLFC